MPNTPVIEGADQFIGDIFHTGFWPKEGVDFSKRRVGIIGTGSSGIQAIPVIAETAEHLTVFQRTPNYTMPAYNKPLTSFGRKRIEYPQIRESSENPCSIVGYGFGFGGQRISNQKIKSSTRRPRKEKTGGSRRFRRDSEIPRRSNRSGSE